MRRVSYASGQGVLGKIIKQKIPSYGKPGNSSHPAQRLVREAIWNNRVFKIILI
jgi:hypothetical protein